MINYARSLKKPGFLALASLMLALQLCAVSSASTASYAIFGRVYTAERLVPGQPAPNNPLSAIPATQKILKDKALADTGMYAITTRSMVRVSVETDSGAVLAGPFMVRYNGGYSLSFTNPDPNLKARMVVRNVTSNDKLMESDLVPLSPVAGSNTLFLLVEGDSDDMGKPHPGTKLFTMVGRIPNDGTSITSAGLANVPAATVAAMGIPQYQNAPFGSTLNIDGAFSSQYYAPGKYCYKVFVSDINAPGTSQVMDPLYKTHYVVTTVGNSLTAKAELKLIGPQKLGNVTDCYAVTPISATVPGQEEFWNLPDQLIRWDTSAIADATKVLSLKLYNVASGLEVPLAANPFSKLKLRINNERVVVEFASISNGGLDMLAPANACKIVDLSKKLDVTFKAYHPNPAGFLQGYSFTATPNHGAGITLDAASYAGAPLMGTPVAGTTKQLNQTNITHSCAYVLGISAVARTTDGYWNFNWDYKWQAFYLQ